jgi:hypothetical protein
MRADLFLILGGQNQGPNRSAGTPAKGKVAEPNLDVLKESPCVRCGLFVKGTICPYVRGCSKIDQFQRLAAIHCTLYKPHDVFPIGKI